MKDRETEPWRHQDSTDEPAVRVKDRETGPWRHQDSTDEPAVRVKDRETEPWRHQDSTEALTGDARAPGKDLVRHRRRPHPGR